MRIPRIYHNAQLHTGNQYQLDAEATHHLIKVLRYTDGDSLILFNGLGGEYTALLCIEGKKAFVRVLDYIDIDRESRLSITLLQGISKGDRMDMVIQKSVELGVSRIIPIICQRTVVNLKADRLDKKIRHWQGILINACEQSGRTRIPELITPVDFKDLQHLDLSGRKLTLDPHTQQGLQQLTPVDQQLNFLIGPEGGLNDEELEWAQQSGFQGIQLGPRILRTETAALAALALSQTLWGDFRTLP